MNHVYLVPTSVFEAHPPAGRHLATRCGDTDATLVVVEEWLGNAQDPWEQATGALELVAWEPLPPTALAPLQALQQQIGRGRGTGKGAALAPSDAAPIDATHTGHAALKKLRANGVRFY